MVLNVFNIKLPLFSYSLSLFEKKPIYPKNEIGIKKQEKQIVASKLTLIHLNLLSLAFFFKSKNNKISWVEGHASTKYS